MKLAPFCLFFLLLFLSCKKERELVEVQIPDPEVVENQSVYGNPATVKVAEGSSYKMKGLKYAYQDLAPFIDGKTMELHYSKHHLTYANKLNKAVLGTKFEGLSVEEILKKIDLKNDVLRNNAGGYYNHNLFFSILKPKANSVPIEELAVAIDKEFGSFDILQQQLSEAAATHFGSGWVWLVVKNDGSLAVTTSHNQDNPLMPNAIIKGTPILAIDLWEHAYYLQYQNRKSDYVTAIFNILDWEQINTYYLEVQNKL